MRQPRFSSVPIVEQGRVSLLHLLLCILLALSVVRQVGAGVFIGQLGLVSAKHLTAAESDLGAARIRLLRMI